MGYSLPEVPLSLHLLDPSFIFSTFLLRDVRWSLDGKNGCYLYDSPTSLKKEKESILEVTVDCYILVSHYEDLT